jgi:hypothetical protein
MLPTLEKLSEGQLGESPLGCKPGRNLAQSDIALRKSSKRAKSYRWS